MNRSGSNSFAKNYEEYTLNKDAEPDITASQIPVILRIYVYIGKGKDLDFLFNCTFAKSWQHIPVIDAHKHNDLITLVIWCILLLNT